MKTHSCGLAILGVFALNFSNAVPSAEAEAGRWKLNAQGCYWDANDSGPDQCSPNAGRWKLDGAHCYWAPSDSGPHQCDPTQPSLPTNQANAWVAGIDYLSNAGLNFENATDVQAEVARLRSNIPMTRFPQELIEFANGFKQVTEYALVTAPVVPVNYQFFNVESMPGYGQVPIVVIPREPYRRVWTCAEKIERQRNLKQVSFFWREIGLGGTAFVAFSKDHPTYGRYTTRAAKFTVVAAAIALYLDELYVARDAMPCRDDDA